MLVHLYEELGEGMVERLEGMFAFAIWDAKRRRVFAARDRFGEKPLLSGSVRVLMGHRSPSPPSSESQGSRLEVGSIDRRALSDYLELLHIPAPRTIYQGAQSSRLGIRWWPIKPGYGYSAIGPPRFQEARPSPPETWSFSCARRCAKRCDRGYAVTFPSPRSSLAGSTPRRWSR